MAVRITFLTDKANRPGLLRLKEAKRDASLTPGSKTYRCLGPLCVLKRELFLVRNGIRDIKGEALAKRS